VRAGFDSDFIPSDFFPIGVDIPPLLERIQILHRLVGLILFVTGGHQAIQWGKMAPQRERWHVPPPTVAGSRGSSQQRRLRDRSGSATWPGSLAVWVASRFSQVGRATQTDEHLGFVYAFGGGR